MAPTEVVDFVEYSLKLLAFSLFLRCASSQSCNPPLPPTCTCDVELFECASANLTEFPATLPNAQTLQIIILNNNKITTIPSNVTTTYPVLQKLDLSSNPVVCDTSLAGLIGVLTINGTCSNGDEISSFLETLQRTTGAQQTTLIADTKPQPLTSKPASPKTFAPTTQPEPSRLYIIAIVIGVLLIVVVCIIAIWVRFVRNPQREIALQIEAVNSAENWLSIQRFKQAGAGNQVYSTVTTEI